MWDLITAAQKTKLYWQEFFSVHFRLKAGLQDERWNANYFRTKRVKLKQMNEERSGSLAWCFSFLTPFDCINYSSPNPSIWFLNTYASQMYDDLNSVSPCARQLQKTQHQHPVDKWKGNLHCKSNERFIKKILKNILNEYFLKTRSVFVLLESAN